eukprot:s721_g4.t1
MSEEEFWVQWQKVESGCQGCVDVELTKGLLLACPTDEACRTDFYERVKALLTDLATFTPLSTDSVETVHGHIQSRIHKFRSRLKQAEASSERTLLMSLIAEQKDTLGMVKLETLPKAQCVAAIQRTESRNKKGPRTELRRINGWNVFLRESLKGPKLSKTDFKRMEHELGSKWKQMSQTDKQRYEVRAMWEMTRRDHWLQTPLPIGSNVDDCAQELGQRMQHKMNLHRLGLNFRLMQEHSAWDMGLALSDSHGALRQQFIELDQTDEDIEAHVLPRLASVEPLQSDVKLGPRDFAGTCHMIHGLCGEAKNLQQVQGLVRSLAQVLKRCGLRRGALLQLYPDGSDQDCEACFTCFLASQVVRPMQHVFVIGSWAAKDKVSIERQAGPIPVPEMRTSAELFDLLLQIRGGRVEPKPRVCLRELEYEWDPVRCSSSDDELSPSLLQVTILKEGPVKMLNGPNPMRSQGKRKKRLPFGFDKFKKRAAGQTVASDGVEHPPRKAKADGKDKADVVAKADWKEKADVSVQPDPSSSSSSEESATSASSVSGGVDDSDSDILHEQVAMPSAAAEQNAREVVPAVSLEILQEEEKKSAIVERNESQHQKQTTFFAQDIGFSIEADLAKSGRSTCFHCKAKIPKGLPRYPYHYNRLRPYAWMHAACVVPFVNAEPDTRKAQALRMLRRISEMRADQLELASSADELVQQLQQ